MLLVVLNMELTTTWSLLVLTTLVAETIEGIARPGAAGFPFPMVLGAATAIKPEVSNTEAWAIIVCSADKGRLPPSRVLLRLVGEPAPETDMGSGSTGTLVTLEGDNKRLVFPEISRGRDARGEGENESFCWVRAGRGEAAGDGDAVAFGDLATILPAEALVGLKSVLIRGVPVGFGSKQVSLRVDFNRQSTPKPTLRIRQLVLGSLFRPLLIRLVLPVQRLPQMLHNRIRRRLNMIIKHILPFLGHAGLVDQNDAAFGVGVDGLGHFLDDAFDADDFEGGAHDDEQVGFFADVARDELGDDVACGLTAGVQNTKQNTKQTKHLSASKSFPPKCLFRNNPPLLWCSL